MCCFVLCYFANTKIDESFRTAKIRRTFFGNSLASKFAGCVRKDDFGSGRLWKNRRRKRKTAQFRRTKGRDDPFIIRKIQSHMQFGFGTSAFFSYLCPAIRNSGLSWLNGKIWKIYLSSQVHILLCGAACAVWHGIWFPTSLRRGLYALTATKVFQSRPLGKQTVVRVRIFTGAAQRSPKSTPP